MIKRPLCLAAVLILCLLFVLTGGLRIAKERKPSIPERQSEDGSIVTVQGTVYRREENPKYQVYYLTDIQSRLKKQIKEHGRILVYVKRQESTEGITGVAVGNTICVSGELRFYQKETNPGNFNQKLYYQKQGIFASVWCKSVEVTEHSIDYVKEWLTGLRLQWKTFLVDSLGKTYGNSMSAILLGDKSELDSETKKLYQKSGIGHILAISGLHMSFIGISIYRLLRKCGIGFAPAGLAGILLLSMYTLMIGAGVSSLRAVIMYLVRMGAEIAGRDYDILTSLAVAAVGIILWQPLYLFDAGFLLSFGAILAIAAVAPVLESAGRVPPVISGGLSIQILLLPVMLYYYFEIPVWSVLLNLLVIPMMSVMLGAGLAGSLLALFWRQGGMVVLQICKWTLWFYGKSCTLTMELPFGRLVPGQPEKWWIVWYYVALFGIWFYWSRHKERAEHSHKDNVCGRIQVTVQFLALTAVFCIVTACSHGRNGELSVTTIDVGQGDGIYIRTAGGRNCLIDGGSSDVSNVGIYRIEPFLESQGVRTLDYVFVSHGDEDHINGIEELLQNQKLGIRIAVLVLPEQKVLDEHLLNLAKLALQSGTKVVTMQGGKTIREEVKGGVFTITCLAPGEEYQGNAGNEASMVLYVKYKGFGMLLTGDVEGNGEKELVQSGLLQDINVLKVAHHGSKNSSGDEFLNLVKPEIAMISAGRGNRYGHPHQETLNRLEQCGSKIYSTQSEGALRLVTNGKNLEISGYKTGTKN